jgi:hypothetical protein
MHVDSENRLLTPGKAQFEIEGVWDKDKVGKPLISKAGNPMIRLKLFVTDLQGERGVVWDYVLLNTPNKITALLDAIGKPEWIERFNQQNFNVLELAGTRGCCTLKNDNHETYGNRTIIGWYLQKKPFTKDTTLAVQTDQYKIETPPQPEAPEGYPF